MRPARALVGVVAVAGALVACASPEATRSRAGGPGGDVGNRGAVVSMHAGSDPYWETPRIEVPVRARPSR
jgi:hypothetical protein